MKLLSFLVGKLSMSEAIVALISVIITTIGLTIINKILARPTENWQQAAQIREELRVALQSAHEEIGKLSRENESLKQEIFKLKQEVLTIHIDFKAISVEHATCLSRIKFLDDELNRTRMEFRAHINQKIIDNITPNSIEENRIDG